MLISVCKSKIHRVTITDCNRDYVGSISIDADLIKRADLVPYEKVLVANVTNGERFETYVLEAEPGSGTVALNGAAARKGDRGDLVIIIAYGLVDKSEASGFKPVIVHVDGNNKPTDR
ncbi:MAG TPA: aspartate 1-decarboxylase [Acidobacteriota bacterium]|nr:aspartate 1-decarboxylase [Acidobacteriota bacterium]